MWQVAESRRRSSERGHPHKVRSNVGTPQKTIRCGCTDRLLAIHSGRPVHLPAMNLPNACPSALHALESTKGVKNAKGTGTTPTRPTPPPCTPDA